MRKPGIAIAALGLAGSQAIAAPPETPAAAYQSTVVCAATMAALQQNPHPDVHGSLPDPGKLALLATHMRDAALTAGGRMGHSRSAVDTDIHRQVDIYSGEFQAAKTPDALHELQTQLGRSVLGCALVGIRAG